MTHMRCKGGSGNSCSLTMFSVHSILYPCKAEHHSCIQWAVTCVQFWGLGLVCDRLQGSVAQQNTTCAILWAVTCVQFCGLNLINGWQRGSAAKQNTTCAILWAVIFQRGSATFLLHSLSMQKQNTISLQAAPFSHAVPPCNALFHKWTRGVQGGDACEWGCLKSVLSVTCCENIPSVTKCSSVTHFQLTLQDLNINHTNKFSLLLQQLRSNMIPFEQTSNSKINNACFHCH
ncbi:hypothetical protein DUNSADRAFT_17619 [Dunaliella salina]|uniref:Encoded protein n=1 Tax=Dunaliella salina TaxID=3046 RepID=A0ABQ7GZV2_DUNSA|nr:hypothetical protein DUNSADRAFT_17619 [Dunaliella salina]|eukprot:KAF5840135.1 hypothetical protein DUNSADRAFT_17619 [Dunaliella salina]